MIAGNEKYVGAPATIALENTTLSRASESRNGVVGRGYPRKPAWSARKQSTEINSKDRGDCMLARSRRHVFRPAAALLYLNRDRPSRTFEFPTGHEFIQIHVMHIQQIRMLRSQRREKFIQHAQRR